MHVSWTFTGDGFFALAGGALAIFGVWLSNRQSVLNLQRQLDAEKKTREAQEERAKRSVAIVLLFEIDAVYHQIIHGTFLCLKEHPISQLQLDSLARMVSTPVRFLAYESNMGFLGGLNPDLVEPLVRLYGQLVTFLTVLATYSRQREHAINSALIKLVPLIDGYNFMGQLATPNKCISDMRNMEPALRALLKSTCQALCHFADADWVNIRVLSDPDLEGSA